MHIKTLQELFLLEGKPAVCHKYIFLLFPFRQTGQRSVLCTCGLPHRNFLGCWG